MNIFVLDLNPNTCAQYHHDIHLRKMIIETAQLLSAAHHAFKTSQAPLVYKATHINHPCAIWVRASLGNYQWTLKLFEALCAEYLYRTGKPHKTGELFPYLNTNIPTQLNSALERPQCMPDEFKKPGDVVTAYRNFYAAKKLHDKNGVSMAWWTKRTVPPFIPDLMRFCA